MTVTSINGQNVIDLVMQVYGNMDNIVAWCIANNVGDINYMPPGPTEYVFNDALISDGKTNNYVYVTAVPGEYYTTESGDEYYTTEDGGSGFIPE